MLAQWPKEMFDQLPNFVWDHISLALEHGNGERTITEVKKDILAGTKQVWLHSIGDKFDFTIVTQIMEHPSKKVCEVVYSGGSGMIKAMEELRVIEDWARMNGCTDIHAVGRKYLSRTLGNYGYSQRYITVGKKL